jgi:hypothetical protein
MSQIAEAVGAFVRTILDRLTHGDSGSTFLGMLAAAALGCGINFADLFSEDRGRRQSAVGQLVGALAIAVYGYFIGKPKAAPKQ